MATSSLVRSKKISTEKLDFNITTIDGTILKILPKNRRLVEVRIILDEIFDDITSVASVGTSSNNEAFIAENENELNKLNEYIVRPGFLDLINTTTIRFYIDPKTSTTGKGTVFLDYI